MRKTSFIKMLLAAAVAVAVLVPSLTLAESAGVTNYIAMNTSITSWPTNTAGTNGLNRLTGGPIGVYNQEWAGLSISGRADSNTVIGVQLVLSQSDTPPVITLNTNGDGKVMFTDWQNPQLASQFICFSTGANTNAFNYQTNLDRAFIGAANWIGVYQITNGVGAITNLSVNINKKVMPIRLQ